jgi:hypothetical protein
MLEPVMPGMVDRAVRSQLARPANPSFDDPFFRRFFDLPELPRQRDVPSAGSGRVFGGRRELIRALVS